MPSIICNHQPPPGSLCQHVKKGFCHVEPKPETPSRLATLPLTVGWLLNCMNISTTEHKRGGAHEPGCFNSAKEPPWMALHQHGGLGLAPLCSEKS